MVDDPHEGQAMFAMGAGPARESTADNGVVPGGG
jgi:hypothetical protein